MSSSRTAACKSSDCSSDAVHLELDGTLVDYRVIGDGSDVLVLHGLSGSWRWWTQVVELLEHRHRLHFVGLPRLGRVRAGELAPWLGRFLDAAELERVDVVGHSLGGLLATELAAQHPERVRRLVLVAPTGISCERGVLGRSLPLFGELLDVRERLPTIVADAIRTGPVSLVHGVAYVWERDLREDLHAVTAPTLLLWGDHDRLVPARVADEWQRLLPDSRLVRLHCGHVPMWSAPQELAASVLAFLGDEVPHDPGDQGRLREVDGVGLTRDDDEPAVR
jgi:pimeloyl-ACP methyl ester carboxylesterase